MKLEIGSEYRVKFPFTKGVYSGYDEDGPFEEKTWQPGCRGENVPPDDAELVADGEGEMILTIIDIHKPGKYPERVFYTRMWRDPEGKEFGKGNLNITTSQAFKRRATSYGYPYRVL